jgi:hypothetical protein
MDGNDYSMIRRFIIVFLLSALPTLGQVPSCSNYVDQTEPETDGFPNAGSVLVYLPHATGANNTIIVHVTGSSGDTITVTDDKTNTYTLGKLETDTTNTQTEQIYYSQSITASANPQISVNFCTASSCTTDSWVMVAAMECTNVGAVDGTPTGNFANSNTVSPGSITPTQTGDLFVLAGWNDWTLGSQATIVAGSQSNITWQLWQADRAMTTFAEWGVYNSVSALNPQLTKTGTTGYVAVGIAFKAASVGTAFPTGIQVTCVKTFWIDSSHNAVTSSTPRTEQWPCPSSNNSAVVQWLGGQSDTLTSVADSASNTWTATGAAACGTAPGGCTHSFYTKSATISATQTITLTGTGSSDSAKMYGVANGNTSTFFDKTATTSGNQTSSGNLTGVSITPTTSSGLVISALSVGSNTQAGLTSPTGALFTGCLWTQQSVNPGGCDENNGWGYVLNSGTSSLTFTWSPWSAHSTTAAGQWVNRADAFESAPTGASTPAVNKRSKLDRLDPSL